jgi:hypothetical protein
VTVSQYYPQSVPVFMGLSTDTKPAAPTGSKFIETDTGNVWLMLNTSTWSKVLAGVSSAVPGTAALTF